MSESNSTASFLIDSLLDTTIKKDQGSTVICNESALTERGHVDAQKPNHYNLKHYHCQAYSDRSHYRAALHQDNRINYDTGGYARPHTYTYETRYQHTHYNTNGFHQWGDLHKPTTQPHHVYSYYSNGAHPYEYSKGNAVTLPYLSSTVVESTSDQYPSMVAKHDTSNYDTSDNSGEIPKKVVLSEESYLKLLESYRLSEELKHNSMFKKKRKQRTIFTKQQTELLESVFNRNEYITLDERAGLAKQLKISEKQVKIWFQNRRNKLKKINTSLSMTDAEKPQCSADTEEEDDDDGSNAMLPVSAPDD